MKTLYTTIIFLFSLSVANAQGWYNPTLLDSIDFESPSPYLQLDTSEFNLWQIAPPQKTILNAAISPTNVIITDSIAPYPISANSHFDIFISQENSASFPEMIIVKFKHQICSDSLRDGGYITYSCDMGENWLNVISETSCSFWDVHPGWEEDYRNLYSSDDTLFNGEFGFSGCMDEWEEVILDWHYWPVLPPGQEDEMGTGMDTLIIRFNFISDTINDPFDGWMIDDIQFMQADIAGRTNNPDQAQFSLYPNPAEKHVSIELDAYFSDLKYRFYNSKGQLIQQGISPGSEQLQLELDLPNGIYFLDISSEGQSIGKRKLMVRN